MTLRERARLATEARQRKAQTRATQMCRLVDQGAQVKGAAYLVGVSQRTATRYRGMVG